MLSRLAALYASAAAIGSTATALAISPRAECSRAALLAAADAYVAAQTAGSLSPLESFLAANWTYEENNKPIQPGRSVAATKALKIDHRRTIADEVLCATFTELISAGGGTGAQPYVIGTQIRHNASDANLKISLIDSVASTTGSWLFDAPKTLQYTLQESWAPIPADKRDSRAAIQAAGDAYLDLWSSATAESLVPWGMPCNRLEGGSYTGRGRPDDTCRTGVPSNHSQAPNSRRRYVVDPSMGSVSILCLWEHMMNAADSHQFRLEGGKLRYIHTMTECGGKTCRL